MEFIHVYRKTFLYFVIHQMHHTIWMVYLDDIKEIDTK